MNRIKEIVEILKSLSDEIRKKYNARIVGIFGSYVREEQNEKSDLDILVSFFEGATLFDFVRLSDFLEEKFNVKIDIVPVDTVREEIKGEILKEAVYL